MMEERKDKILFSGPVLLTVMLLVCFQNGFACSGYKVTVGDKTVFGSNEDAWRLTPRIWFESGTVNNNYGAAFTGSRYDGANGYAPQSGMNEMGLAFERLTSFHPRLKNISGKQTITNPTKYLKDILHTCKTVEEVHEYISRFDHSYFIDDVFLYVDRSGKYLIVEPYTLTIGNEPTYVISNFCPSITSEQDANHLTRYQNGVSFLKNKVDTTLEFCTHLSDTMHVCREKIGDGTLLTSIWDLNMGTVNLYFYHDYTTTVQFNLKDELKKGDHMIAIETLFPSNKEFEKLRHYKIPQNSPLILLFILGSAGLFVFSSIFFAVQYFRRKQPAKYAYVQWLFLPIGLILFYYMYVLISSIGVFYFSAPYKHPQKVYISISSYIPFLLLLLIIPSCVINYRIIKEKGWSLLAKGLFTFNNIIYMVLICFFIYWGLYNVFR